jgi:histidine triad (HIT) family protein
VASCLFCRIVEGQARVDIVHSSDEVLAFRDINPQAPTHILLIPKEHIPSLRELEENHTGVLMELVRTAARLAGTEGIDQTGWRLVANVGSEGGQTVRHLHLHLLGGRRMRWPPG